MGWTDKRNHDSQNVEKPGMVKVLTARLDCAVLFEQTFGYLIFRGVTSTLFIRFMPRLEPSHELIAVESASIKSSEPTMKSCDLERVGY